MVRISLLAVLNASEFSRCPKQAMEGHALGIEPYVMTDCQMEMRWMGLSRDYMVVNVKKLVQIPNSTHQLSTTLQAHPESFVGEILT